MLLAIVLVLVLVVVVAAVVAAVVADVARRYNALHTIPYHKSAMDADAIQHRPGQGPRQCTLCINVISGLPVSEANRGPLKIDIACKTSCITVWTSILGNAE